MSSLPIASAFNDGYVAEQYEAYRRDPASVDESWRQFFRFAEQLAGAAPAAGGVDASLLRKAAGAAELVGAIQRYGHLAVQLDPLGTPPPGAAELEAGIPRHLAAGPRANSCLRAEGRSDERHRCRRRAEDMRDLYCGALAYEFEHLNDESEREWFRATIASGTRHGAAHRRRAQARSSSD